MNLSELSGARSKLKRTDVDDRSAPRLHGYMSEGEIAGYQHSLTETNAERWLDCIADHTFATKCVPFESIEEIRALHAAYTDPATTNADTAGVDWAAHPALGQLVRRVGCAVDSFRRGAPQGGGGADFGVFAKLSCRSPKDSVVARTDLSARYRTRLASELERLRGLGQGDAAVPTSLHNIQITCLLQEAQSLLKVRSAQQIFDNFCSSLRIHSDLITVLDHYDDPSTLDKTLPQESVVVRQWEDIDVDMEFRGFGKNGSLTALSQYNHLAFFPRLPAVRTVLGERIAAFFNTDIGPRITAAGLTEYVVDFAVTGVPGSVTAGIPNGAATAEGAQGWRVWVIELNPFKFTTDPALFSWHSESDVLEGRSGGPFEFRIVEKPPSGALALMDKDWAAMIRATPPMGL